MTALCDICEKRPAVRTLDAQGNPTDVCDKCGGVYPGTRCECKSVKCAGERVRPGFEFQIRCHNEATRVVDGYYVCEPCGTHMEET